MNELTEDTIRGLVVPADLKAAQIDGARLAYTERGSGNSPASRARR